MSSSGKLWYYFKATTVIVFGVHTSCRKNISRVWIESYKASLYNQTRTFCIYCILAVFKTTKVGTFLVPLVYINYNWTAHILGRSLKGWASIGYSVIKTSVCLCVCTRATGHSFWPRNLNFWHNTPWDIRTKRNFFCFSKFWFLALWGPFFGHFRVFSSLSCVFAGYRSQFLSYEPNFLLFFFEILIFCPFSAIFEYFLHYPL